MLKKIDDQDHDGLTGWKKSDMTVGHPGKGKTKKDITDSTGGKDGKLVRKAIGMKDAMNSLKSGIYVVNGMKFMVVVK